MEEKEKFGGFMSTIFNDGGTVVEYDPSKFNLDDMGKWFVELNKQDLERRAILDKEYTPLSEIKLEEMEEIVAKNNGEIPRGAFVKVQVGGRYVDMPFVLLLQQFRDLHESFKAEP